MKKRWTALTVCLALLMALAGCGDGDGESAAQSGAAHGGDYVQGVTDTEILIGNTAVTTGFLAGAGLSFNAGLSAALKVYNDAGGFQGRSVRLINRSDGYDAEVGAVCTRTLVEEDGVFALVGHFGAPTVEATLRYIKDQGVPMVYAAAGVSELYQEEAEGYDAVVFPVQPVYETEGRALLARALAPTGDGTGLGGARIGVLATTADDGKGLKAGVEAQAMEAGVELVCQDVDAGGSCAAAVRALKEAGCDVVILCAGWSDLSRAMNAMRDANYDAKCITSSANASAAVMGALADDGSITGKRPLYAVSWMDASAWVEMTEYFDFIAAQTAWEKEQEIKGANLARNSYAAAGYIAGTVFTAGLKHLEAEGRELTWANFVQAMEMEIDVPMGGKVDFTGGRRQGLEELALKTVDLEIDETGTHELVTVSPLMSLEEVWAHVDLDGKITI